jgi:dolichol-phosphate mannosyltransferase
MLLGFTFSVIAFLGIPVAIAMKIAGMYVSGIATVLLAVLLLGGVQLIAIGVIGEYLGRVYDEVKRRPIYVVRDRVNMVAAEPAPDHELSRSAEPQPR